MPKRVIPVEVNGVSYPSIKSAAEDLGVRPGDISVARRKGTLDRFVPPQSTMIPVTIRGKHYRSCSAAAKAHGVCPTTVQAAYRRGQASLDRVGLGHTNNVRSHPVRLNGVTYPSKSEAARRTGLSHPDILKLSTPIPRKATT